jgi:hypothetical protein
MSALRRLAARLLWIVPFTALGVAACEHNPQEPGSLASIVVTRASETLAIGTSVQFTATGYDGAGNVVGINPTWSVAAGGGTIVAGTGVFTAGTTPGTFANTVKATVISLSGTASVVVVGGPVATITVTPTPVTLGPGATQQYTAVGKDASNNVVTITPSWSVAAGGGAINIGTGLFTAGNAAGTYTNSVTASVGSIKGTATVTVSAAALAIITVTPNQVTLASGANQTFNATGKDINGNPIAVTPTWSVVAGGGTIVAGTGVFTAGTISGLFATTVKATSGTVSGYATVTVAAGALATITVFPNPAAIGTNASRAFTAVGRDAHNNVIPFTPNWSMLAGAGFAGGTILSPSGVYTAPNAVGSGIDSIRVCSTAVCGAGSIAGFARVNVSVPGALVSIVVTPNPASVLESGTTLFTATGSDAAGITVPTPGLTWSVVPAVGGGTIGSGTGVFTAGTTDGTFVNAIQATSGAVSGFATVTVAAAAVPPSLGAAATHGILAGTAVTCAGVPGTINGDASVWPGSSFSGFGGAGCVITGQEHAADLYAQTAQGDLTTAFLALAALPCGTTITADLGGTTLAEGVYCSSTSVGVTGTVTLTGNANSVFVIRAASGLTTAGNVVLIGGVRRRTCTGGSAAPPPSAPRASGRGTSWRSRASRWWTTRR